MRKYSFLERLIAVCCIFAIMLSLPWTPVSAAAETGIRVTASTNASVKQGNSAYCYVYIDSMESLSTLEVTVHFDPTVAQVTGSYNQVGALLYDSASTESTLQYTYIFDGNGPNTRTQLFYFQYTVQPDAPVGEACFDVVVGDAFDASFNTLPVSGSRCSFNVAQTVTNLTCSVRGTSSVSTTVNEEFTLSYSFSTTAIASGSVVIRYDPELFAVSEVVQGGFLTDKMADINTSLSGAVYLSFLGTQYGSSSQLLTLRFKTLKNVTQTSSITMQVSDLYDLQLNPITCSGYTTSVKLTHDPTVDETAPRVFLEQDYDPQAQTLQVRVCLEENSHLGAGDFVLQFDTERLAYQSAVKSYYPTFFNINDKNVSEGLLKYSVISLSDMTAAVTMLTATFQVVTPCEDTVTQLQISGSGLANYLTAPIVLNFSGCTVEMEGHTAAVDEAVMPDCVHTGLTEGSHCSVCKKILVAQNVVDVLGHDPVYSHTQQPTCLEVGYDIYKCTRCDYTEDHEVAALGHDLLSHGAKQPDCTEIGWDAYETCSRCDYTTYQEIPANGHTFQKSVCVICGAAQEAGRTWDISAAADGSLVAKLYPNADGTYDLHLSGSGAMKNWGSRSDVSWYSYRTKITGLLLPEGLVTIGDYAFYGMSALTEIALPESLEAIGYVAFYECTGLTELTLPEHLETIGNSAFSVCTGITELVLPENVVTIGNNAFSNCTALTAITLPESLETIGSSAFFNCTGLEHINFNSVSLADLGSNNYVFTYAGQNGDGITVSVGSNVTKIPAYLFYPYTSTSYIPKITSVEFAENSACQSIGSYAFYGCTGLTELLLPESLQSIGNFAFSACSNLILLTLPESLVTIGGSAFYNCTGLVHINFNSVSLADLGSNNYVFSYAGQNGYGITVSVGSNVTRIPAYLFNPYSSTGHIPKVTSVVFEEGSCCQQIGNRAFYENGQLIQICIPETVTEIGQYAFYSCTKLVIALEADALPATLGKSWRGSVPYVLGVDRVVCRQDTSFAVLKNGSAVLTRYYGEAEEYAVAAAVGNAPVMGILEKAFYENTKLQRIQWPEDLESIGENAFYGCTGLQELTLPESLQSVGNYAFYGCTGLQELTLPGSLQSVGNHAFYGCTGLTEIRLNAVQMADLIYNNGVFGNAGKDGDGITLTVGCQVTRIPAYLFYPGTGSDYTSKVTEIIFEEGSACQSIGSVAFAHNTSLLKVQIPETVNRIENSAFYYCKNLIIIFESDTLPEYLGDSWASEVAYYLGEPRVATVGDARYVIVGDDYAILSRYDGTGEAFTVENQVEGIPVTAIASAVFRGRTKLTSVTLPESLLTIGSSAFYGCTGLTELILPESLENIGNSAFYGCTALTELALPESLVTIGGSAFYGCTGLTELTLPESLETIGDFAFYNCMALARINLNAVNLADLGSSNYAFSYAGQNGDGITVSVGSNVTKIPAYLFYPYNNSGYTPKITSVEFAEESACQSVGTCAFYSCSGLTELALPESLVTVGGSAFYGCSSLEKVTIASSTLAGALSSNSAAGCLLQYAKTVLLPGTVQLSSYLQNKYANQEQIIRDGVAYWLLDQNVHNWQETQTLIERVPCQKDGLIRYTCDHCNNYKDVTVERHTIIHHEAKEPDCETVGWEAYENCAECAYTTYVEIPALGHWAWEKRNSDEALYVAQNDTTYPFTRSGDVFASSNRGDSSTSTYAITAQKDCVLTVYCKVSSETNYDKLFVYHNQEQITVLSGEWDWQSYSLMVKAGDAVQIIYQKDYSMSAGWDTAWFRLEAEDKRLVPAEDLEPTCLDAVVCTVCEKEIKAALGHDKIPHEAQTVTCLDIGWDAYETCSRCDYTTYVEIPALGHDVIKHAAVAPTCLDIGWNAYETCGRCDYTTYVELPATGHWVLAVTEENDAAHPFTFDGTAYASSNRQDNTTSAYTITAIRDCSMVFYGKVSSEANYDKLILRHNNTVIVELSGQQAWWQHTLALNAGDVVTISYRKDGSQSSGQDTAWFRYELAEEDKIPAADAQPTCTRAVVCKLCGEVQKEALGHDPVYSHTQQPTCLEVGYDIHQCTRCDYTEKYEIAALGHDPVYSHTQQPTCLEVGYDIHQCTRCDYTEKYEIAALGHDLIPYAAKQPNCTEIGWDAYETCTRCDYTTYKAIPANGHSFVETFCTVCDVKQTPLKTWDVSAGGDGSLMAYLYKNYVDGGYELEINGSGAMADYGYSSAPWYSYRSAINRVSLGEGLTYIGTYAFAHCDDLRLLRIPDSVERISSDAFNYSKKLVVVMEGDNPPPIPSYGWYGCGYYYDPQKVILAEEATYVIDKDGNAVLAKYIGTGSEFVARETVDGIPVTRIGRYAFYQKSNLKTYWIPNEIQVIGDSAFDGCNGLVLLLENTRLPASLGSGWNSNCSYYLGAQVFTEGDFRFVKDKDDRVDILTYLGDGENAVVPAQAGGHPLTRISNYGFYGSNVKRVVLPEGITALGYNAFGECRQLREIQLPQTLTSIDVYAFNFCSALREIRLPENLKRLGSQAFWYCSSLQEIVIPDSITNLESSIFCGCTALKKVVLPDSIKTMDHMVFYNCSKLSEVNLPKSLTYMSSDVFYQCTSLQSIELPENLHSLTASTIFNGCTKLKVVYVRSPRLAATLTNATAASYAIQNAVTVVVPAGTGTDYLKETYSYCETRMRDGVSVDVYSKCAHRWETETVSEYVRCVSDGYEIHTCSLCGVWTDDWTPMHILQETVVAPTCVADGYTLHTCPDCGTSEQTDPVAKLGHSADLETFQCTRCGEAAYLVLVTDSRGTRGFDSWSQAVADVNLGGILKLQRNIAEDVELDKTVYLDLNGYSIYGTLTVADRVIFYGMDSATDDFAGSYGTIAAVKGDVPTDVTNTEGKRYVALTGENGVSFHRLQLQLRTVSLRTTNAGIYYRASVLCDEALRSAIVRHGTALSLERMPGEDFAVSDCYTWADGAPAGDFTSGIVENIFRSDLTPEENAARGEMKIYANAYLQLADGTVLMADTTTGDTVDTYGFNGVAWSLRDMLEALDRDISLPAYAEYRQQILAFCEAWKDSLATWQLVNLTN